MREAHVFDQIARTLASPMPRRQALGRILGALAGAGLAALVGTSRADDPSTPQPPCTIDGDCKPNRTCCVGFCCPNAGWVCCGGNATPGSGGVCCPPGQCKHGRCEKQVSPS
jgi:hypothetical protein